MLKHMSNRPTSTDHVTHPHALPNGYVSTGRYCNVPSKMAPSQQHQHQLHQLHQQQQQQQHQQQLHVSLLNTSKHSLSPTTSVSPGTANHTKTTLTNLDHSRDESLPFNFSGGPLSSSIFITDRSLPNGNHTFLSNSGLSGEKGMNGLLSNGGGNIRHCTSPLPAVSRTAASARHPSVSVIGVREMLTSLGLLCLVSLMMALLALTFLLKMNPPPDPVHFDQTDQVQIISPEESGAVYEVSLALCSLSLTLDVCCCVVCAAQLLFAARLITASTYSTTNSSRERIKDFLKDSAATRICAIAGFFISIPVFLTDVILYTILQFPSTPAISTSIVVTLGIVLCGCAMLHNIVVWQRHKSSRSSRNMLPDLSAIQGHQGTVAHGKIMSPSQLPVATLDLSGFMTPANANNTNLNLSNQMLELSTLV